MQGTDIFNGSNGKVWITTDDNELELGSMQSFTVHQANNFEDINEADFLGVKKRFLGYEITGTISKFKVDSAIIRIMEQYKNGNTPDITLIGKAYNPNTDSMQVLKVIGVTFTEADLINLEQKTATQEEIPYSAESYKWIALT